VTNVNLQLHDENYLAKISYHTSSSINVAPRHCQVSIHLVRKFRSFHKTLFGITIDEREPRIDIAFIFANHRGPTIGANPALAVYLELGHTTQKAQRSEAF